VGALVGLTITLLTNLNHSPLEIGIISPKFLENGFSLSAENHWMGGERYE